MGPPPARSPTKSPGVASAVSQPEDYEAVAHQAETTIEAGEDESSDAGYNSDNYSSTTTSLGPSVRDYAFENGRRYHKFHEGTYLFPNDEPEQEREDMKHAMIINLCGGKLHYAPLEKPQNIIDLGTGTGIWAIDMGDEYPSAEVLGIDLSPIQQAWIPPNVRFLVDDAECPWAYAKDHFDFVHVRHMTSSIKNFPKLVKEAYDHLKPGGWIELQELFFQAQCDDNTMPADYKLTHWLSLIEEGLAKFDIDLLSPKKHPGYLRDTGFTNVQERVFKVPIGTWPKNPTLKKVGLYNRCMIVDGLQGNSMKPFTKALGWSVEEVEVFNVEVRKACENAKVHSYFPFHVVYAQKPLE
ncbi:hypothetical protein AJ80_03390 [Polytolypa hystricis UAMH7299]|uniref:Methyltransferase domain-containing protein n=1 Tax=Polytolypa hystricis (strain UAMH7299) TaxID=1447883 RepID=A0A2B7YJV8_POLH7|nr:hypothetical protein AJ80_03390 [Polytolypa hystricis UAMH7299]